MRASRRIMKENGIDRTWGLGMGREGEGSQEETPSPSLAPGWECRRSGKDDRVKGRCPASVGR